MAETGPPIKYIAVTGLCFLALKGNIIHFSTLTLECLVFCTCVTIIFFEFMNERRVVNSDEILNESKQRKEKNISDFETFLINKKKIPHKGSDHILQRVTEDWKLDTVVANEISKLVKLVIRDYIYYWFCNISKRNDFIIDMEELVTNIVCILCRRGKDFINPYMFVGDKVCDVLVRTLTLFRLSCQKIKNEFPDIDENSSEFQLLVANEFRMNGHLHVSLMLTPDMTCSVNSTSTEASSSTSVSEFTSSTTTPPSISLTNSSSRSDKSFKSQMSHSSHSSSSSSDLSMEEFFSTQRLQAIESEYSFYIGGYLTKYLLDTKDENSKAGRRLFTEMLSAYGLGSAYWMCTPSCFYYYLNRALVMSCSSPDSTSEGGGGAGGGSGVEVSSGDYSFDTMGISEMDLHVGLKEYYLGTIGQENVSSSCCFMAAEAAAAIVLRQNLEDEREESQSERSEQLEVMPSAGHFIIRKYCVTDEVPESSVSSNNSLTGSAFLPAIFCLSYVRPLGKEGGGVSSTKTNNTSSHWHMSENRLKSLSAFEALRVQPSELCKWLCRQAKSEGVAQRCPVSYRDSRIGHVFFIAHSSDSYLCYEIFSCSHESDLRTAIWQQHLSDSDAGGGDNRDKKSELSTSSSMNSDLEKLIPRWFKISDLLSDIRFVVPTGLLVQETSPVKSTASTATTVTATPSGHDDSKSSSIISIFEKFMNLDSTSGGGGGGESRSKSTVEVDVTSRNEKILLLKAEKDILLKHEISDAVDDYLGKKFAQENKIIQISSSDEGGKQAIKFIIEAMQNVCLNGWLKKEKMMIGSSNENTLSSVISSSHVICTSREEGSKYITLLLSKMYSKVLLNVSTASDVFEDYVHKSPILWLWLSHIISHCKGSNKTLKDQSGPSLEDNSLREKLNISQHCVCLKCNGTNCYVQSMDIFMEHHGTFFLNKEITLESLFECIFFCGLQTGKVFDILELTSLFILSDGSVENIDNIVKENGGVVDRYCFNGVNVETTKTVLSRMTSNTDGNSGGGSIGSSSSTGVGWREAAGEYYDSEALLKSGPDVAQALHLLQPIREHYLHFFKGQSSSVTDTSVVSTPARREDKKINVFKSMSLRTFSAATSLLDDISSSISMPIRDNVEPNRPQHLLFSTNMDIIQVSNIKIQTAEDKWHQKVGEGALFGSELQRRAEVAFILRILLRDRPPLEFLESRAIIRSHSLSSRVPLLHHSPFVSSYNIEILKYEKLIINEPGSNSGKEVVVYYIDVYKRDPEKPCLVHPPLSDREQQQEEDDSDARVSSHKFPSTIGGRNIYAHKCSCEKWTVKRRYSDFDELHKHLKTQVSSSVFNKLKLPQKSYVQVVQSSFFYSKRLVGLREYLRSILITMADITEIFIFLSPDDEVYRPSAPLVAPVTTTVTSSSSSNNISALLLSSEGFGDMSIVSEDKQKTSVTTATVTTITSTSIETSETSSTLIRSVSSDQQLQPQQQQSQPAKVQSPTAVISNKDQDFTNVITNDNKTQIGSTSNIIEKLSATTLLLTSQQQQPQQQLPPQVEEKQSAVVIDRRTIDLLETRMFRLVDEILENSIPPTYLHVIKKNIVTLICHSMSIFFNGTFVKLMQIQAKPETTSQQIASLLAMGRECFWPNDVLAPSSPVVEESEQRKIDVELRDLNITMLNNLIPKLLQGQNIVEKMFLLIDNPFILKSLAYMIIDILIIDMFPELANKLSGMDALQK